MKIIDILNMIALKQKLPKEIEYNGDIGILVKENGFINYIFEKDGSKNDLYRNLLILLGDKENDNNRE